CELLNVLLALRNSARIAKAKKYRDRELPKSDCGIKIKNLESSYPMELRNYQKDFCSRILSHFASGQKRVLAQMPTGGGKTQVFSAIAAKFVSFEKKVLILAHREELIYQAANKIKEVCGIEAGIIKASEKMDLRSPIQVASVQTLARRLETSQFKALKCDLVVVDEAHHVVCSTYQKILDEMPRAYCLGVTATPSRLDGKGFREVFDEIVCSISPKELIEQGYLSRYKLFADSNPMSTKGLKIANGDYRASDVAKINDAIAVSKNLVESYQKHLQGKRCLVFAINVAHSRVVADAYSKAGVEAVHLDGQTDKRIRKSAIEAFASGEVKVLCNVELFTEGTDIPALDGVQIARPTASLAMWLQMVGRVL
ncbi:MAG: DEAD/DEAH box helicase, partial [Alphaproteobacteria bacterium]